jgi:hypothetical protein
VVLWDGAHRRVFAPRLEMPRHDPTDGFAVAG